MDWDNDNFEVKRLGTAQLVNARCNCKQGVYHVSDSDKRIDTHNQIPHRCTNCNKLVYFTHPYPFVAVNGVKFVHWETIRGINPEHLKQNKEGT